MLSASMDADISRLMLVTMFVARDSRSDPHNKDKIAMDQIPQSSGVALAKAIARKIVI